MSKIKILDFIYKVFPKKYHLTIKYNFKKLNQTLDKEMLFVNNLLNKKETFIDIGANIGIYSYHFRKLFNQVKSFEPIHEVSSQLKSFNGKNIEVFDFALSDKISEKKINIPFYNNLIITDLSSFHGKFSSSIERRVKTRTLDSFNFKNVDLIKIDVEGHEMKVLEGAKNTLRNNKPLIIIEIEQRHLKIPINTVFDKISNYNYEIFYLEKNTLTPIKKFKYEINQKPFINNTLSKNYINNFILIPKK